MVKNEEVIHEVIRNLALASNGSTHDEALKYTQAALNLSHVLATLSNIPK